jgi:hypothetical protein
MSERPRHTIRHAARTEMAEISDLVAAAIETFRGIVPDRLLDLYIRHSCDVAGRWRDTDVLVIEADGRIAGTVTYVDRGRKTSDGLPEGWSTFRSLAVHPQAPARGSARPW